MSTLQERNQADYDSRNASNNKQKREFSDFNKTIGPVENLLSDPAFDLFHKVRPLSVTGKTFTSGNSSIGAEGVNVDPNVVAKRDQSIGLVGSSLRDFQQSRVSDPQEFMDNRLDPLREGIQKRESDLVERQRKTGLEGSEFGRQSRESLKASGEQKLKQGEAMAFDEVMSVMGSQDKTEGDLLKLQEYMKTSEFAQDAQARGMSSQLLASLTNVDLGLIGKQQGEQAKDQGLIGTAVSLIASFF